MDSRPILDSGIKVYYLYVFYINFAHMFIYLLIEK